MGTVVRFFALLIFSSVFLSGCFSARPSPWDGKVSSYVVRKGDTLHDIGLRFFVSSQKLAAINDIDDPDRIAVGSVLKVPVVDATRLSSTQVPSGKEVSEGSENSSRAALRRVSAKRASKYRGKILLPVKDATVTSKFGWRWLKFHEGIDLAAPEGTHIHAAHDGTVVYVSNNYGRYGRIVVLKGEEFLSVYAHNCKNRVSVGDEVARGDWIADVGKTGDATGSHVHFETRVRDDQGKYAAVDPMHFLAPSD